MQGDNFRAHLQLHLIVFIWGFTAILGALISIQADALVWYRMILASGFLLFYILFKKVSFRIPPRELIKILFVGLLIAIHWIFFFKSIHIANVSITLAVFSLGAFFTSILEPLFYKRKTLWYEVLFGLVIFTALAIILQVEINYFEGMLYALVAVIVGVFFTLFNGKLIKNHDPSLIAFYELGSGAFFITLYFIVTNKFDGTFFKLTTSDWIYLLLLSSICTAYAFTAGVKIMKKLSPYTVMLTTSLEPVYGIILAYFIIGGKEKMSFEFYVGAVVIVITVVLNGVIKRFISRTK